MTLPRTHFWKKNPFVKLLLAMMAGILIQWQFQFSISILWIVLTISFIAAACFFFIPFFNRYKFAAVGGIVGTVLFFSLGAMLTWQQDVRNDKQWLGNHYSAKDALVVTLDEPPVEKTKSIKANATVNYLIRNEKVIQVNGKIIVYLKKDSSLQLAYGSQIIINKPLQEIKTPAIRVGLIINDILFSRASLTRYF